MSNQSPRWPRPILDSGTPRRTMVLRHPQTRVYQSDRASRTACRTATHPTDHTPRNPTRESEKFMPSPLTKVSPYQLVDHGLPYKLRARNQGEPVRKIAALAALIIPASASASLTPSATGRYVALAYSPLHVGSVIYGYNTVLADAQSSALALCRKALKTGCRGSIWVQNGWIAYASVHGPRGGVGWGYGASKSFASNTAMKWCLATQHTAPNMGKCGLDLVMPTKPLNTRHARGGHW